MNHLFTISMVDRLNSQMWSPVSAVSWKLKWGGFLDGNVKSSVELPREVSVSLVKIRKTNQSLWRIIKGFATKWEPFIQSPQNSVIVVVGYNIWCRSYTHCLTQLCFRRGFWETWKPTGSSCQSQILFYDTEVLRGRGQRKPQRLATCWPWP